MNSCSFIEFGDMSLYGVSSVMSYAYFALLLACHSIERFEEGGANEICSVSMIIVRFVPFVFVWKIFSFA